jgi:hypothetical protein
MIGTLIMSNQYGEITLLRLKCGLTLGPYNSHQRVEISNICSMRKRYSTYATGSPTNLIKHSFFKTRVFMRNNMSDAIARYLINLKRFSFRFYVNIFCIKSSIFN